MPSFFRCPPSSGTSVDELVPSRFIKTWAQTLLHHPPRSLSRCLYWTCLLPDTQQEVLKVDEYIHESQRDHWYLLFAKDH